ncbi:hypothetical protein PRJ_5531 (plasmid) [Pseudomonas sp. XWY-1]|nr:hypothetical protein PRJ_5531 [Pseudomonas sp. XWY-1]
MLMLAWPSQVWTLYNVVISSRSLVAAVARSVCTLGLTAIPAALAQ